MTPQEFLNQFGTLAEAEGGVKKLRELIIDLAVRGKLVCQDDADGSAQKVLDSVSREITALVASKQVKKKNTLECIETDEIPFDIPDNWLFTRLENVSLNIHYGYTASANHDLKDVLLVRITDIQDNGVAWATVPGCEIKAGDVPKYELRDGDLLIARTGGTIGKTFLVDNVPQKAAFASYLIRVIPGKDTCPAYLKRFLESPLYWQQLYAASAGTGQPNVNATALKSLILPLPPLAEQHRIVAKVDELMRLCDGLEAVQKQRRGVRLRLNRSSLDRLTSVSSQAEVSTAWQRVCDHFQVLYDTPETLPDLRQTILQLAVKGKLVKQDPNDEPADISALNAARQSLAESLDLRIPTNTKSDAAPDLPSGWIFVPLGATGVTQTGSTPPKNEPDNFGGPIPFIKPGDLSHEGVRYNHETLSVKGSRIGRHVPAHSLLMVCIGGSLGKAAIVNRDVSCNQQINYLTATPLTCPEYVLLSMRSPDFQREAWARAGVGTLPIVSKSKWEGIPIPLPPLSEQKRIVSKVTDLLSQVTRLESTLTRREATRTQLLTAAIHAMLNGGEE